MAGNHPRLERAAQVALIAALAAGAALRLAFAFSDDGIYWPDEIYKTLEPAHRVAFGYGLIPWEFVKGASSWLLPGPTIVRSLAGGSGFRASMLIPATVLLRRSP